MYPQPEKSDPVQWDKAAFKDPSNGRNYNSKTQDQGDAGTDEIMAKKIKLEQKNNRFFSNDPGTKFSN